MGKNSIFLLLLIAAAVFCSCLDVVRAEGVDDLLSPLESGASEPSNDDDIENIEESVHSEEETASSSVGAKSVASTDRTLWANAFRSLPRGDSTANSALQHIFGEINEARQKCKKALYKNPKITHVVDQPGKGTNYMIEFVVDAEQGTRTFHANLRHIMPFMNLFHRKSNQVKKWHTEFVSPAPCSNDKLLTTFMEIEKHNSNPEATWQAAMYEEMFGRTVPLHALGAALPDIKDFPADRIMKVSDLQEKLKMFEAPSEYDFRKVYPKCKATSWVNDQGQCGSCYAQAAVLSYGASLFQKTQGKYNVKLSAQDAADCTNKCEGGLASNVWDYQMKSSGLVEEYCDPETGKAGECGAKCTDSAKWKVNDHKMMYFSGESADTIEKAVQERILSTGPVFVSFDVFADFMNTYKSGVYTVTSSDNRGAHAVVLIGWGEQNGVKYWIAQNSWSAGWGEKGFFRIRRGTNEAKIETRSTMYVIVLDKPANIPNSCSLNCKNGGSLRPDCSCGCPGSFKGQDCGECPEVQCKNGGQFKSEICSCECPAGATGADCSQVIAAFSSAETCRDGSAGQLRVSWTEPSTIGSYCHFFDASGSEKGLIDIILCGDASGWSNTRRKCPATGSVNVDMGRLRLLSAGRYTLRCAEYLGTNEFGQSRGYGWMNAAKDLASINIKDSGCSKNGPSPSPSPSPPSPSPAPPSPSPEPPSPAPTPDNGGGGGGDLCQSVFSGECISSSACKSSGRSFKTGKVCNGQYCCKGASYCCVGQSGPAPPVPTPVEPSPAPSPEPSPSPSPAPAPEDSVGGEQQQQQQQQSTPTNSGGGEGLCESMFNGQCIPQSTCRSSGRTFKTGKICNGNYCCGMGRNYCCVSGGGQQDTVGGGQQDTVGGGPSPSPSPVNKQGIEAPSGADDDGCSKQGGQCVDSIDACNGDFYKNNWGCKSNKVCCMAGVRPVSVGGGGEPAADVCGGNFDKVVRIPSNLKGKQDGLSVPSPSLMTRLLGKPCPLRTDCGSITNPALARRITSGQVGHIKFTGLDMAVKSLEQILTRIQTDHPKLFAALGSAGMVCCRAIRGSSSSYSNHSWGAAIDFTINGQLDTRADDGTQCGLLQIYPYFHQAGWYWAAGYSTKYEDAMHFEVAAETMQKWVSQGGNVADTPAVDSSSANSNSDSVSSSAPSGAENVGGSAPVSAKAAASNAAAASAPAPGGPSAGGGSVGSGPFTPTPQFMQCIGVPSDKAQAYSAALADTFQKFGIADRQQITVFLANCAVESAHWKTTTEYGNKNCVRYDGGCRYKGRGIIQLTHRSGYAAAGRFFNQPFVDKPELAAEMPWAFLTAGWFWVKEKKISSCFSGGLSPQCMQKCAAAKINGYFKSKLATCGLRDPNGWWERQREYNKIAACVGGVAPVNSPSLTKDVLSSVGSQVSKIGSAAEKAGQWTRDKVKNLGARTRDTARNAFQRLRSKFRSNKKKETKAITDGKQQQEKAVEKNAQDNRDTTRKEEKKEEKKNLSWTDRLKRFAERVSSRGKKDEDKTREVVRNEGEKLQQDVNGVKKEEEKQRTDQEVRRDENRVEKQQTEVKDKLTNEGFRGAFSRLRGYGDRLKDGVKNLLHRERDKDADREKFGELKKEAERNFDRTQEKDQMDGVKRLEQRLDSEEKQAQRQTDAVKEKIDKEQRDDRERRALDNAEQRVEKTTEERQDEKKEIKALGSEVSKADKASLDQVKKDEKGIEKRLDSDNKAATAQREADQTRDTVRSVDDQGKNTNGIKALRKDIDGQMQKERQEVRDDQRSMRSSMRKDQREDEQDASVDKIKDAASKQTSKMDKAARKGENAVDGKLNRENVRDETQEMGKDMDQSLKRLGDKSKKDNQEMRKDLRSEGRESSEEDSKLAKDAEKGTKKTLKQAKRELRDMGKSVNKNLRSAGRKVSRAARKVTSQKGRRNRTKKKQTRRTTGQRY